jgi:predicted nucleotidyltransferase component of viral defense system
MIPQRDISKAAEHDKVPERTVEKDYAIHWIMLGLATTPLQRRLAFKGGTALRVCYFANYRYSEDIDLTALQPVTKEDTFGAFTKAAEWVRQESAIQSAVLADSHAQHTDGFSFEVSYTGPLGAMAGRRSIKIDVSASERVLFHVEERRANPHYSDIPRKPQVCCYALDEIVAEKFRSILNPARREPRDVYDLWYLFERAGADVERIRAEFCAKAEFKKLDASALVETIARKEKALASLWDKRLANQIMKLPRFEAAFRRVHREAKRLAGG